MYIVMYKTRRYIRRNKKYNKQTKRSKQIKQTLRRSKKLKWNKTCRKGGASIRITAGRDNIVKFDYINSFFMNDAVYKIYKIEITEPNCIMYFLIHPDIKYILLKMDSNKYELYPLPGVEVENTNFEDFIIRFNRIYNSAVNKEDDVFFQRNGGVKPLVDYKCSMTNTYSNMINCNDATKYVTSINSLFKNTITYNFIFNYVHNMDIKKIQFDMRYIHLYLDSKYKEGTPPLLLVIEDRVSNKYLSFIFMTISETTLHIYLHKYEKYLTEFMLLFLIVLSTKLEPEVNNELMSISNLILDIGRMSTNETFTQNLLKLGFETTNNMTEYSFNLENKQTLYDTHVKNAINLININSNNMSSLIEQLFNKTAKPNLLTPLLLDNTTTLLPSPQGRIRNKLPPLPQPSALINAYLPPPAPILTHRTPPRTPRRLPKVP